MSEDAPKLEAKTEEPKPDTNTTERNTDVEATEPQPKAAPSTPEAKADKPKPDAKAAEPKPEAQAAKPRREFRNKIIFALAIIGVLAALVAAYIFGMERKAQPPVFTPVNSPYESAIYANGMVESDQPSGENINVFPEVSGPITNVLLQEGQECRPAPRSSPSTIPCRERPRSS
jgi:outer membrane biosynthesis protein TonB